jgi:PadR family transcriptional regulator AphA
MSLKHAMLGFIKMMPVSGYDLKRMFDSSVQYYWSATHSQIYQTLDRMLKDKLVTREIVRQDDHPNKKIYHITEAGKQELHAWLSAPKDLPVIRHQLLIQLAWADELADDRIISLLETYAAKIRERLSLYVSREQRTQLDYARSARERYLWEKILENGIMTYRRELEWVQGVIAGLGGS